MNDRIVTFLCKAKRETYAGAGVEQKPSRPNSHDLLYQEESLKYIDSYLGSAHFAGEEALWENETPFWSMNYIGRVLSDNFCGDFLKQALSHVPQNKPYRGPAEFSDGSFVYRCFVDGEFDWFIGFEEIMFGSEKVYECRFHGGLIKV